MTSLHLCTIIEGLHARMAELPAEMKTDDTILPILLEQIAAEYQRLKVQEEADRQQTQVKLDEMTKREGTRDTGKPSHRSTIVRTLRKDKRNSKNRNSGRDNDRKTKRREFEEQQDFGEEDAAQKEAAQKGAVQQEAARKETAQKEAARQEAAQQEAARQESAQQGAARKEAARKEAAQREEARQEAARQEAAQQEAARKEAARQEAARKEAAQKEEARQEAAQQEASRKEAAQQEAEQNQKLREKAKEKQAEEEDAYLKSMKEARDEAIQEQAKAEQLEKYEAFLKSMKEAKDEAIREQAKVVLSIKDQALRRQAYNMVEMLRRQMSDEEIARRYIDEEEEEGEEDEDMIGVPLPGALTPDDEEQEPEESGPTKDPWEELFQEIIDEATLTEAKEEKARRAFREQQEEVETLRQQEPKGSELTKDPWEELFQEIIDEATLAEVKDEKERRAIREQQKEEVEALSQQFDDDEIARRWNEGEEEKVTLEGAKLPDTLRTQEEEGVPLFSQPTKQPSEHSSSDEEPNSDADSSARSRSSSASSATSNNTATKPDTEAQETSVPENTVPATESSKPKVAKQPFHPALDKTQPIGSRYPTTPLHGNKRNRGPRVAKEHIAKRRVPRSSVPLCSPRFHDVRNYWAVVACEDEIENEIETEKRGKEMSISEMESVTVETNNHKTRPKNDEKATYPVKDATENNGMGKKEHNKTISIASSTSSSRVVESGWSWVVPVHFLRD
ncbi:hypothetical protein EG327_009291 [Venturia inaequalis]|uniref:Uncharacterized protein n=1 Tax=Venturia inaequalis TaxID=5025 RepID=A0A8H3UQN7_VENIN|nr:hypothetical protein EG327_009291 [Venturia inaequalis]